MTDYKKLINAKELVLSVKSRFKNALSDLENLENTLSNYWDDDEQIAKNINKFLSSTETAFLKAKNVMSFYPDICKEQYACDYSPWTVTYKNGEYLFTLPPMVSKRNAKRAAADGKVLKAIVSGLCSELDINEPFEKAQIEVTFFVNKITADDAVPDFDNVDLKAVIDAFQGKLIKNDTALDYVLICKGTVSDESKTTVLVKGLF